jgi:hypothetical protein
LGDEDSVAKQSQHFVTEDKLGLMGIDVGNGLPRTVIEEQDLLERVEAGEVSLPSELSECQ